MRPILLAILACFLVSCVSATRVREAHCLSATIMDTWEAKNDLTAAEDAWRVAQQARFERSLAHQESRSLSDWIANGYSHSGTVARVSVHSDGVSYRLSDSEEERALYQRVVAAHARYGEAAKWYGRVVHRVQTRLEEDDMLYPLLGMLATSTGIVFYPLIRWNVRSVLWDGEDPDADNDPVQVFCSIRLRKDIQNPHP